MKTSTSINLMGRRIVALREKDAYFDALCDAYNDLNRQIEGRIGTSPTPSIELERMKRQRAGMLDTILFLLDDQPSHKHAA